MKLVSVGEVSLPYALKGTNHSVILTILLVGKRLPDGRTPAVLTDGIDFIAADLTIEKNEHLPVAHGVHTFAHKAAAIRDAEARS